MFFGGAYGHGMGFGYGAQADEGPVNLLDNGDFSAAAPPPTLDGAVSIADGKLEFTDAGTATWSIPGLVAGSVYRLTFDLDAISVSVAGVQPSLGGASHVTYAVAEAEIVQYFIAGGSTTDFVFTTGAGDTATIDNAILEGPLTESGEGTELVTGGDFASSTGWTVTGSNASITGGVFRATGGIGAKQALRAADAALVRGRVYRGRVDIPARTGGTGNVRIGGTSTGNFTSTGSKTTTAVTGADTQDVGLLIGSNGNMDMDNLSIKEVLFS